MMKMFPRGYREGSIVRQSGQLAVSIPQWVSELGLEWLHELLLRWEALLKPKAPRQG
jgi:hypothetical protein